MKSKNKRYYGERRLVLAEARKKDWQNLHIDEYAGAKYYTAPEGSKLLYDLILGDEPFYVCRIGETELRTMNLFRSEWYRLNKMRYASYEICINAGFFPRKLFDIRKYCDIYYESMMNADYLGMMLWDNEEFYMSQSTNLKGCFQAGVMDALKIDRNPWLQALKGMDVLVISPFTETIKRQYDRRDKIFSKEDAVLTDFNLKTFKSVQSIGGKGTDGFSNWFEAFESMKEQIDAIDFDIALLSCGSYGMPLSSYLRKKGKKVLYVGGCLQLMFGILGKRWEIEEYAMKHVNEYWVRPDESERPKNLESVEGGCYW